MAGKTMPSFAEELRLERQGYRLIAGVDEVGRGPLAGPVFAAAVILRPHADIPCYEDLRDSKVLTANQRQRLSSLLWGNAVALATGAASPEEIDNGGIVKATKQAMLRAIAALPINPDHILVDALPLPESGLPFRAIIKGDALCRSIAAASIVAKVARDSYMMEADVTHPGYGFARNKGYPTQYHLQQLAALGPCPIHRRSFAPVRSLIAPEEGKAPSLQRVRGVTAEDTANRFLEAQGYVILQRNYRCPWGEIDIVAQNEHHIAFVEVKARRSNRMGSPLEAITPRKQQRLIFAAQDYLQRSGLQQRPWQIDVIAIQLGAKGIHDSLEHHQNIVGEF